MQELHHTGEGAYGTAFKATLADEKFANVPLVVKEVQRSKFSENEFEALMFLREEMMAKKLPAYYIFLYGTFTDGGHKYLILEQADYLFDELMINYTLTTERFIKLFYQIARGVHYLELRKFNHGDLWSENVMISWTDPYDDTPKEERECIVSGFFPKGNISSGAQRYRMVSGQIVLP